MIPDVGRSGKSRGQQGTVIRTELIACTRINPSAPARGTVRACPGKTLARKRRAVLGELLLSDARQHLVDHQIDVVVDAAAKFIGHFVGA